MPRPVTVKDCVKYSLTALADLAMARECIVCGRPLMPEERHMCICCEADMPFTLFENVPRNPMSDSFNARVAEAAADEWVPYSNAAALFYYRAGYRRISQALKYRRDFAAGRHFSHLLGRRLAGSGLYSDVDLVVPVPLHWTRRHRRGYNQAAVIARAVAAELGVAADMRLLVRRRRTGTQTRLSHAERARNVRGAFRVLRKAAACHILLVDDVYTTGATLHACYAALREAYGPQLRISVATLGYVGY